MRALGLQFARSLALLMALFIVLPAVAQPGTGRGKGHGDHHPGANREGRDSVPRPEAEKRREHELGKMQGVPPNWMERLRDMSPEAQERFLNNNERFKNLQPERQAQIRRRLQHWNSLTPEQRQAVRNREERWRHLTPQQQQHIRAQLLPQWQRLSQDRRQAILRRLHALHGMSEFERAAKLNDETFLSGLNSEDRSMLRELSNLRVGANPEPPQDNPEPN